MSKIIKISVWINCKGNSIGCGTLSNSNRYCEYKLLVFNLLERIEIPRN